MVVELSQYWAREPWPAELRRDRSQTIACGHNELAKWFGRLSYYERKSSTCCGSVRRYRTDAGGLGRVCGRCRRRSDT